MAILDLQAMQQAQRRSKVKAPSGSRASKGCPVGGGGGASRFSLLLC